jgi:DNA polymerase-3 subunit delta'
MGGTSSNAPVSAALRQMAESGRIPHAMLFHENDGGGAFPLVLDFLDEVYGHNPRVKKLIHPDIHFVFPVAGSDKPVSDQFIAKWRTLLLENPCFYENELYAALGIEGKQGNISVNEARSILEKLSLSAVEGGYRTVVVYLPEKLNIQAANTLLKMVEEPPEKTLFLLITHQPEKVLTTIASRCLFMRVRPLSREEMRAVHPQQGAETAVQADLFHDLMDALVRKDLLGALETGEAVAALDSREKQKTFCRVAGEGLRNLFLLQQGLVDLADIPEDELPFYRDTAGGVRKNFPRLALAALDRAQLLLERNVNQKILFTDLVNRLYMQVL